MADETPGRWTQIRDRRLDTPELKERYERTKRALTRAREVLMLIDAEREQAGISKAELARRIGIAPSAVRRLFSSDASNPTLRTILDMLDVLGIDLDLKKVPSGKVDAPTRNKRRSPSRKGVAA